MDENERLLIRKYVLKNAVDYGGKVNQSSVVGKVISKEPAFKPRMRELVQEIAAISAEVEALGIEKIRAEAEAYETEFASEEKTKAEASAKHRMELPGAVKGAFAIRFAPEPGGYMHIGHCKAAFLARELADVYEGKFFLYFDDTNPEKEKQEFVDSFKQDMKWLGLKYDREYYASDNVPKMYDYARHLMNIGKAYVCTCSADLMSENRMHSGPCEHRDKTPKQNMEEFAGMLAGKYEEGTAVLRYKGDMASLNTAMRDPALMRIKRAPHYRQGTKYIVWPLYDINTPVMDSINGITDQLRTKEYELRDELYSAILTDLGLRVPRIHNQARLKIKDNVTSKRETTKMIQEGLISGYDDPRLVTIIALRRRGVQPQAIRDFVMRFGISKTDSVVSLSMLLDENRKILDPIAKRILFVEDPIPLKISGVEQTKVSIRLHPTADMGTREYETDGAAYISSKDAAELQVGSTVRLKDFTSVKITSKGANAIESVAINEPVQKTIAWVPAQNFMECDVMVLEDLMKDGVFNKDSKKTVKGYAETYANTLKRGEIAQFWGFGFVILDDNDQASKFIMTSR